MHRLRVVAGRCLEDKVTHTFTVEDIRLLAEMERTMDSGEQPHVFDKYRNRLPASPEIMDELGLVSGQTVSGATAEAILDANLASLQARFSVEAVIARRDTQ